MFLDTSIDKLPNTSPLTIKKLKSLNIKTYFDLLNYFPFRWENYSLISKINTLQEGEVVTVSGKVIDGKYQVARTGLKIQTFILADETGEITINFYNQPYLLKLIKKGVTLSVAGKVERFGRKFFLTPNEFEIGPPKKHTGRFVPIYPEKKGLSSKTLREKIFYILALATSEVAKGMKREMDKVEEILPEKIIKYNQLLDEETAYQQIHFPKTEEDLKKAKERLSFDELFLIQLSSQLIKKNWQKEKTENKFQVEKFKNEVNNFINNLPFKLTQAQEKAWREIFSDLQKETPMNRLLQGDVGSGKTVVAALASYLSYLNDYQTLFMAPTEILANQHYNTLTSLFKNTDVKIELITGTKKTSSSKSHILNSDIIVGTHALITEKRVFKKVGLVIIDEQHRFGVAQRTQLKNKGINPHLLTMTATPIPRTVALTIYGELDFSVIDQMPKGRLPVKTFIVPKNKRLSCYSWIKSQISNLKSQVFVVCPLIEESQVETMRSVKAAKREFENLKKIFPEFKLNLLHGKTPAKEKEKIMTEFKNHQFDILVTTSIVEVGVDIPGATIMLIEGADRFGLAQLHQLRGRVGRNNKQSYCFLFTENENFPVVNRLKMFAQTNDGRKLAEEDLKIRGPGDLFGKKQHGYLELKIASFSDYPLIEKTQKAVEYFLNHYQVDNFPSLKKRLTDLEIEAIGDN